MDAQAGKPLCLLHAEDSDGAAALVLRALEAADSVPNHCLEKPFDPKVLLAVITRLARK